MAPKIEMMTKCREGIYYPFRGIVSVDVIDSRKSKPEADIENAKSSILYREEYNPEVSDGDLESKSEESDEKENEEAFLRPGGKDRCYGRDLRKSKEQFKSGRFRR